MEKPPIIKQPAPNSRLALWFAAAANVGAFLLTIGFYQVPEGKRILPVMYPACIIMIGLMGFTALPLVWPSLRQNPRQIRLWATAIFALTPCPFSLAMFFHAQHIRGFIWG